mmetsp:Transcript_16529/g.45456  ORF Transcript_16529/g.45456 Transcript_16529/m.45456 type:complete len:244 (-) Transcript_16529:868-1599(-)
MSATMPAAGADTGTPSGPPAGKPPPGTASGNAVATGGPTPAPAPMRPASPSAGKVAWVVSIKSMSSMPLTRSWFSVFSNCNRCCSMSVCIVFNFSSSLPWAERSSLSCPRNCWISSRASSAWSCSPLSSSERCWTSAAMRPTLRTSLSNPLRSSCKVFLSPSSFSTSAAKRRRFSSKTSMSFMRQRRSLATVASVSRMRRDAFCLATSICWCSTLSLSDSARTCRSCSSTSSRRAFNSPSVCN